MVRELKCECAERYEANIDTWSLFEDIRRFFEEQASLEIYEDIPVKEPYYVGHSDAHDFKWYADKWYSCKNCGCLWEFTYPDFPAHGFVRKFADGGYKGKGL